MRITHIGPMSVARVALVLYGVLGLIFGAFFAAVSLLGAGLGAAHGEESALLGAAFGVGAVILMPLLYGGLGAVMGLFMAWLYNVVAGVVGGVELRMEQDSSA